MQQYNIYLKYQKRQVYGTRQNQYPWCTHAQSQKHQDELNEKIINKKNELDSKIYEKRKNESEENKKRLDELLNKIKEVNNYDDLIDFENQI